MSSDSWRDRESNVDSQTTVTHNGQVTTGGENTIVVLFIDANSC